MLRFREMTPAELAANDRRAPTNTAPANNATRRSATNSKSANGRDREAFNAYQREYMRKRRAAAKEKP